MEKKSFWKIFVFYFSLLALFVLLELLVELFIKKHFLLNYFEIDTVIPYMILLNWIISFFNESWMDKLARYTRKKISDKIKTSES